MADMGFNLFLPWLIILAITYGALEKYEFVSDETQVNGAIAIAFAFLVILGVYQFAPPGIFTNFAAAVAFGAFALVGFMILLTTAGYDVTEFSEEKWSLPFIIAVVIFLVSFIAIVATYIDIGGLLGEDLDGFNDVVMPILILVFFIIVIGQTTSGDGE